MSDKGDETKITEPEPSLGVEGLDGNVRKQTVEKTRASKAKTLSDKNAKIDETQKITVPEPRVIVQVSDEDIRKQTLKKNRASKARTFTRRLNELKVAVSVSASIHEVEYSIKQVKWTYEELGRLQDELLDDVAEDTIDYMEAITWYEKYVTEFNVVVTGARKYVDDQEIKRAREYVNPLRDLMPVLEKTNSDVKSRVTSSFPNPVKIKKLSIPVFESQPKKYLKWKSTFERYTKELEDDLKYDYLLENTKGRAHDMVSNQSVYSDAIGKLDKEFGNKHIIINLLIEDIKRVPYVKKNDFIGFDKLVFEANSFRDRLNEMGCAAEAENTYILRELECKLNPDDLHKWLESTGTGVDSRKVEDFVNWLDHQRNLRRISNTSVHRFHLTSNPANMDEYSSINNFSRSSNCAVGCSDDHHTSSCPVLTSWTLKDRWNFVTKQHLCFQCFEVKCRTTECSKPLCTICNRPHHILLHNYGDSKNKPESKPQDKSDITYNGSTATVDTPLRQNIFITDSLTPHRCFLPIVKSTIIGPNNNVTATTLLDSGSELNVISSKLCEKLGLTGSPITIKVTGVGGETTQKETKVVDVIIKDRLSFQTKIQCIVLNQTCGKALKIDPDILSGIKDNFQISKESMFLEGGEVDLLLGMSSPRFHEQLSVHGPTNGLMIVETRFGPALVGHETHNATKIKRGTFKLNSISIKTDVEGRGQFDEIENGKRKKLQKKADDEKKEEWEK